jgi:hypothetical protein
LKKCLWHRFFRSHELILETRHLAKLPFFEFKDVRTALERDRLRAIGMRIWTKSAKKHEAPLVDWVKRSYFEIRGGIPGGS